MRLGLVIYGSLDLPSGGYLYDRKLAAYLRSLGHELELIALPWRSYPAHLADSLSTTFFNRLLALDVDLLLQDELNHPSLFAVNARLKAQRSFPIVSIVHHLRSSELHPPLLRGLYSRIERKYLESVDAFIFNSHTTKESVESHLGSSKAYVLAQPAGDHLNPNMISSEIEVRAMRPGALKVAFAGNLIRRKAPHLIVEAIAQLQPGAVQLSLAGSPQVEPGYARRLKKLVAKHGLQAHVHFLGYLQDEDLAALLRVSQVLALPSEYEGYGIAYLEGMGFALPAIGTRAGAAGEIISDGVDGFLIQPGDSPSLARRLDELHKDRKRLAEMSQAALQRYQRHPTWGQSMARAANFLEAYIIKSNAHTQ